MEVSDEEWENERICVEEEAREEERETETEETEWDWIKEDQKDSGWDTIRLRVMVKSETKRISEYVYRLTNTNKERSQRK